MSEPINEALEAELRENPDADTAVYGDWLTQRGHPRGELIALQNAKLVADAELLLAAHPELSPFPWPTKHHQYWERGFLRRVELRWPSGPDDLQVLVQHPSARFLRELTVHARENAAIAYVLCENPPLPLRSLSISDEAEQRAAVAAELCRQFPRLEHLEISGTPFDMDHLGCELRSIAVALGDQTPRTAEALCTCSLPRLEELYVGFDYDQCGVEVLRGFFERADLPNLRRLEFWEADSELVSQMLVGAPFRQHVEVVFTGVT